MPLYKKNKLLESFIFEANRVMRPSESFNFLQNLEHPEITHNVQRMKRIILEEILTAHSYDHKNQQ